MNKINEKRVAEFREATMNEIDYAFDMLGPKTVVARLKDKVKKAKSIDFDNVDMNDIVRNVLNAMHIDYTDLYDVEDVARAMTAAFPWITEAKAYVDDELFRLIVVTRDSCKRDMGWFESNHFSIDFMNRTTSEGCEVTTAEHWLHDAFESFGGMMMMESGYGKEDWEEYKKNNSLYRRVEEVAAKNPWAVIFVESGELLKVLNYDGDEEGITTFSYGESTWELKRTFGVEWKSSTKLRTRIDKQLYKILTKI